MIDPRPQADRILVAQLTGEAGHYARWRELTGGEEAAAVAALRELAGGRADLLAGVAGILEGAAEGDLDEPLALQAAGLCRKAGAQLGGDTVMDRGGEAAPGRGTDAAAFGRCPRTAVNFSECDALPGRTGPLAERPASARDHRRSRRSAA